jgi:hypothetical protein
MKSFKVLCIRKEKWRKAPSDTNPGPTYLEVCTVTKEKYCKGVDLVGTPSKPGMYYQLAGYNPKSGFHSAEFIRLPDMTEEIAAEHEHEHEAIIYQR